MAGLAGRFPTMIIRRETNPRVDMSGEFLTQNNARSFYEKKSIVKMQRVFQTGFCT